MVRAGVFEYWCVCVELSQIAVFLGPHRPGQQRNLPNVANLLSCRRLQRRHLQRREVRNEIAFLKITQTRGTIAVDAIRPPAVALVRTGNDAAWNLWRVLLEFSKLNSRKN